MAVAVAVSVSVAGRNRKYVAVVVVSECIPKLDTHTQSSYAARRSFSLTLQCSAPSAHIAARQGVPLPPPFLPSIALPWLTLWALLRHIGKSFWQNCGTKGARYCIADSVCESLSLYVCVCCMCVFACIAALKLPIQMHLP